MIILISQLINRPVITLDDAEPIGIIRDPIIDSANGKVVGYFFGHGFLHMRQDVLAADDIASYDDNRVVVHHADVVRVAEEEPKIREILAQKIPVLSANVYTESGRHLGRAHDLLLDTELSMIVKYYVHGIMSDRIISAEHVTSIERRGIIVEEDAQAAVGAPAEVA